MSFARIRLRFFFEIFLPLKKKFIILLNQKSRVFVSGSIEQVARCSCSSQRPERRPTIGPKKKNYAPKLNLVGKKTK